MQTLTITVHNKVGLHARPASLFVQAAMACQSVITVKKGEKCGNAKSIMGMLALGVNQDDEIIIQAEGADEQQAITALKKLVEENFGECE